MMAQNINELMLFGKKILLSFLDSFTAGAIFIATGLSLTNLDYIYKFIMIIVGVLLCGRAFINFQASNTEKKTKNLEYKIKQKQYEKLTKEN
jgi:hypothetical protein